MRGTHSIFKTALTLMKNKGVGFDDNNVELANNHKTTKVTLENKDKIVQLKIVL